MLDKKEKLVILYLLEICQSRRSYLVLAEQIAEFVVSDSKKGYYYCVTLKGKAITLKKDMKKHKTETALLIVRTLALAVLSFAVGFILKIIFR